jgi:hypothetical protein
MIEPPVLSSDSLVYRRMTKRKRTAARGRVCLGAARHAYLRGAFHGSLCFPRGSLPRVRPVRVSAALRPPRPVSAPAVGCLRAARSSGCTCCPRAVDADAAPFGPVPDWESRSFLCGQRDTPSSPRGERARGGDCIISSVRPRYGACCMTVTSDARGVEGTA